MGSLTFLRKAAVTLTRFRCMTKTFSNSFDLFSKLGRADLLKRLGNYEAALDAYDQVLSVWPQFARARNAKASLLAIAGRLAEAEGLLPDVPPQTEDDWIASTFAG